MNILVINCGSSSLKFQLINSETEQCIAKGLCERIGGEAVLTHKAADGRSVVIEEVMPTHSEAFTNVIKALTEGEAAVISSLSEISAVGHRVVQGGSKFTESAVITEEIIAEVEKFNPLAPLHNPANILGIRACTAVLGENVPQVAVFDTSFHSHMPEKAFMYGVPYEYYEKYGVRRYGFHGTSHRYVTNRVAELMGKDAKDLKIITCHLGNGASIAAVKGGVSVDTSMGFTPLDGFMMGTRTGTLDPSALTFIAEKENLSAADINDICNKIFIRMLDEDLYQPISPDSNENFCGGAGTSDGLAINYLGNFYPCVRYMESSLNGRQKSMTIGDIDNGYNQIEEHKNNIEKICSVTRRSQSTDECFYCPIAKGCGWCSAYNYEEFGTVNKRATYICCMHKAQALANVYYWNKLYNYLNINKTFEMYIPKEWALQIINIDEYNYLKKLSKGDWENE